MSVPHAILGLLRESPCHGYDLKRLVDRYVAPDHPVAYAQIYATLDRLERHGRVRVVGVERVEGPDRRRYAITEAGLHELERWLAEPLQPEPRRQAAVYTKIVLALLAGRPVEPILARERHAHLGRVRESAGAQPSADPAIDLLSEHARLHIEADLRWLDVIEARLDEVRRHVASLPTSS